MPLARARIRTHDVRGAQQWLEVLPVGTRVRSTQHPELTGYVKRHEYHASGAISPIPYAIQWDDERAAARLRGPFFVYATDAGIEPIEESQR